MKNKQAEREAFFDFYKQNAEPEEEKVYEPITIEPRPLPTVKDNPFNGANCLRCKWLDKTRTYNWCGTEFYVCKRKELMHKAEERAYGESGYEGYVRASDLQTDGYLNGYAWKCENCGKAQEVEIAIKDYDKEKDKQKCSCGGKLKRVIEWSGIAEGSGAGWFGKSDGSNAI